MNVSGTATPKAATLVGAGDGIDLREPEHGFVSRGGLKLEAALEAFDIDVSGRRAIDLGASTGGFTDCLLQRGAASVVALDVGYGQLDWTLRRDERVVVIERTNLRHADPEALGGPFSVVVADLSFISLRTVADQLIDLGDHDTDYILLIKPQFEAGPELVGRGGVVRDDAVRIETVATVIDELAAEGLGAIDVIASPVTGAKSGNREVVGWFRLGPATVEAARVREAST